MIPIGKVVKATRDGKLVVKAEAIPQLGAEVRDASTGLVGYVDDIIGPVASPYIVVKLSEQRVRQSEYFVNRVLYATTVVKKLRVRGGLT